MDRELWNRRHAEPPVRHWATETNPFLEAELGDLPPGRALDLACGQGRNAAWLAARGWQVTGVDFSEVALGHAREHAVDVEWIEADLRDYEPAVGAFDLVTVLYLQIPSRERRTVLARAAAALAPGGTLLVVGHHLDNEAHGPRDPDVLYTPEQLASELPGLEIEKAEAIERPTDEGVALDALLRARMPR